MQFVKNIIVLLPLLVLPAAASFAENYQWVATRELGGPNNTTVYKCVDKDLGELEYVENKNCSEKFIARYHKGQGSGYTCYETTPNGDFVQWVKAKKCSEKDEWCTIM